MHKLFLVHLLNNSATAGGWRGGRAGGGAATLCPLALKLLFSCVHVRPQLFLLQRRAQVAGPGCRKLCTLPGGHFCSQQAPPRFVLSFGSWSFLRLRKYQLFLRDTGIKLAFTTALGTPSLSPEGGSMAAGVPPSLALLAHYTL